MDWQMWKSHNGRRGCENTSMSVSAVASAKASSPPAGLHWLPYDCSGTNQTVRITHVSKSLQAWSAKCCSHSPLFFPALTTLWEMCTWVFSRALSFLTAVARLIWALLRPSDPQYAMGWKVLCSPSSFVWASEEWTAWGGNVLSRQWRRVQQCQLCLTFMPDPEFLF